MSQWYRPRNKKTKKLTKVFFQAGLPHSHYQKCDTRRIDLIVLCAVNAQYESGAIKHYLSFSLNSFHVDFLSPSTKVGTESATQYDVPTNADAYPQGVTFEFGGLKEKL